MAPLSKSKIDPCGARNHAGAGLVGAGTAHSPSPTAAPAVAAVERMPSVALSGHVSFSRSLPIGGQRLAVIGWNEQTPGSGAHRRLDDAVVRRITRGSRDEGGVPLDGNVRRSHRHRTVEVPVGRTKPIRPA